MANLYAIHNHCKRLFNSSSNVLVDGVSSCEDIHHPLLQAITEDEVSSAVQSQKSRAPGICGFSPFDLKAISPSLSKPLSYIFSYFLENATFYTDWLKSSVFFLFKGKGTRDNPSNYRSICIQDPFAKLFSSILAKRLSTFAEQNNLLPLYQFGFRSKRSTTAAAAMLHEVIHTRLNNRKRTYVAYVDFKQAFDRVSRPLLFQKLALLGIPTQFCRMLDFIFRHTIFFIKSGNFHTDSFSSNVGVPQGDPISPILFNLFISDLPSSLHHNGILFHGINVTYIQYADDLCIIGDTAEDLQRALNDLKTYCMKNIIEINVAKTKVQVFHRGRLPPCSFHLEGQEIDLVNEFCYLGFIFSVQLSFSSHTMFITSKARSKCGQLFAQLPLQDLPLHLVLKLFDTFILPVFSYGLAFWIDNSSGSSLQAVNATFTKFLKRYLQIPLHSSNSQVHFITSTTPLTSKLKQIAPNYIHSLSFPEAFHGHRLSFLPTTTDNPSTSAKIIFHNLITNIHPSFWLSKIFHSLPTNQKARRRLCRELFDADHYKICENKTFHPHPNTTCICINCGENAHLYHDRYCPFVNFDNQRRL